MISVIGSTHGLKKSMIRFAERLNKTPGFRAEVGVFNRGMGGKSRYHSDSKHNESSFVTLEITTRDGLELKIKIYCGGHGRVITWTEAREALSEYLGLGYDVDKVNPDLVQGLINNNAKSPQYYTERMSTIYQ